MKFKFKKKNFSSFQIISLGFFIVILTGGFLLMLPISTKGREVRLFWTQCLPLRQQSA